MAPIGSPRDNGGRRIEPVGYLPRLSSGFSGRREMLSVPDKLNAWQMVQPAARNKETGETRPGKLELAELQVPELKAGEVLVKIAGTVVAGDKRWIGKEVLIPAVMPCRQCHLCKIGRGNRCLNQKMPGNSI